VRGFVWSQFRFRRNRILVLGLAILVAAVSFVLLTSTAKSSSLHIQGTLKTNFRPAYDILVRPRGSKTPLERQQGLVPPNYLSGIFGGITLRQWRQILGMRGVAVAAPIANIGYILPLGYPQVPLRPYVRSAERQILRVRGTWLAYNRRVGYSGRTTAYVYVTRRAAKSDRFTIGLIERLPRGKKATPCSIAQRTFGTEGDALKSPFAQGKYMTCYSTRSPDADGPVSVNGWRQERTIGVAYDSYFPLLLAAIDPVEEARLVRLPRTIVAGRYLGESEDVHWDNRCLVCNTVIPVLVARRTYLDEPLRVEIDRLELPPPDRTLRSLASPSAAKFVTTRRARRVGTETFSSEALHQQNLHDWVPTTKLSFGRGAAINGYWDVGGVNYQAVARDHLRAQTIDNPASVWHTSSFMNGVMPAPPGSEESGFRRLRAHADNQTQCGGLTASAVEVGQFDQSKLPGFSPLSRVPLETYSPPVVTGADDRTRGLLGGRPLGPTMNLGDYVAQPPFLLTNLRSAMRLLGRWVKPQSCVFNERPFIFQHTTFNAPISVVRVRVKGVKGPDPLSLERIKLVAQQIHDKTGLDVDITAGSSPHPLVVDLPAGKFGRPELAVREGWSKKGVSVNFLRALDRKDLLLFGLILVICGFFLGNGALAAVHARRAEIGTLRTLGWPRRAIFGVVLAELVGVGLIAGVVGAVLALSLVAIFDLHLDVWRVVLVIPLAVGLALLAGLVPALMAGRGEPLDALRPPVAGRGRLGRVRSVAALALANLWRLPTRTLLGAAGLFVGVGALTVLVAIERSFGGTLVGTLLGNAISVQVRGSDFVAVGLTILLAAVSVADVLYLNLRERSAELATLRAVGWSDGQLRTTVVLEALGIGLIGSVSGAVLGLVLGASLLGVGLLPLVVAAAIAGAGGIAVAIAASLVPLSQVGRLTRTLF
jgi:putative ABC transport system permease protein